MHGYLTTAARVKYPAAVQRCKYLADLNEQARKRLELIIEQLKAPEGVTEDLKITDQMSKGTMFNTI
ncbi:MAG: TnpV protein [Clostridium sp.]|nr:TnpV protein [Clostridium sp.]